MDTQVVVVAIEDQGRSSKGHILMEAWNP